MPAVHPDLAAGTASFTSALSNADLICRREIVGTGNFKTKINAVYRLNSDVLFIGAATSETASAVIPSHQPNDLLIVFAVNGSGTDVPIEPAGEGWESLAYTLTILGYRLAYKFARTNSETVGSWVGSTRTTVVVYRNVRKIAGTSTSSRSSAATSILYPALSLDSAGGTRVAYFSTTSDNLDSSLTPSESTTRVSTQSISGSAPGVGAHDFLIPNGITSVSGKSVTCGNTQSQAISIEMLSGKRGIEASSTAYAISLNGDIFKNRLSPVSRRYSVTLPQVFWLYRSYFSTDSGSFATSLSAVNTPRGYSLDPAKGEFSLAAADGILTRFLVFTPLTRNFAFTEGLIEFAKGFFTGLNKSVFSASFYDSVLTNNALLEALSGSYDATSQETALKRALIEALAAAIFNSSTSQVGFRNDTPFPTNGGPFRPTVPFHLQPSLVKYNSVSKSRDLGIVNNFLGQFSGLIGSETGAPTLFFKITTLEPAGLRIIINPVNRFTDNYISVGIADANRKSLNVNDFGFAYENELTNTERLEFLDLMPADDYYFTISSSQWQKIPYSVEIQAIRFMSLSGVATLTNQSTARFAISKLRGPALLTGPLQATIPTKAQLKQPTGLVLLTSVSRGEFTTPEGVVTMRMLPTGRLKMTHKIGGTASVTGANIATLSSAPPYGGGYGP